MPSANDSIEGFSELLATSGVTLLFEGTAFKALFSTQPSTPAPYALTPGDDQAIRVAALASVFPTTLPAIGDYFDDAHGNRYRIKSRIQRPRQPVIRFTCEVFQL